MCLYGLDAKYNCILMLKIRETISKAWNWVIIAVFSIKSRESATQLLFNCSLMSASFRKDYLQLNLLHSLKTTCFHHNVLRVCSSVAKHDTTNKNLLKKYEKRPLLCEQLIEQASSMVKIFSSLFSMTC